ncbi:MAG: GNAT family N-acetyltransferase [Promethearchaeota archaeon]
MSFDPFEFSIKRHFGSDRFHIRPAQISDRDLVWKGYKNAPREFFNGIIEISWKIIEMWYPNGGKIDYEQSLPFNAMRLNPETEEVEFAGNVTLDFMSTNRWNHTARLDIGVLPKFQRRGLGSLLMELAIKVAQAKHGIARLELYVVAGNQQARNLYSKFGFEEEGVLRKRWIYPDGKLDDTIVMSILFPEKMKK